VRTKLKLKPEEMAELVKTARTDLGSLSKLTSVMESAPYSLQTECFDAYSHHLRKPIRRQTCESKLSLKCILLSLLGIGLLDQDCSYFEHGRPEAHKQRFANSWPQILGWLKAIFGGHYFHDDEQIWFGAVDGVFRVAVSIYTEALMKDDVFELAVDVWNGYRTPDGGEYFSAKPLFVCLNREIEGDTRIDYILKGYKNIELLVNMFVSRLKHATFHSPPIDVQVLHILASVMGRLDGLHLESKSTSIFLPSTGPSIVTIITALMGGTSPSEGHLCAARSSLSIIYGCLRLGPVSARKIVEAGVLIPLLKLASFDSESGFLHSSGVLTELLQYLIYSDVVTSCQRGLRDLYTANLHPAGLLKTSRKEFRDAWKVFESVLFEQTVLLRLFRAGYSTEAGRCSSLVCRKSKPRPLLKKCGGCAFGLYCSRSCQKADWTHHRSVCKKVDEESFDVFINGSNRFLRKVATIQICRHWKRIVSLARDRYISAEDLAVRIIYDTFPFQIEVFDYHELLDNSKQHPPQFPLAVNNIHRCSGDSFHDLPVVLRMGNIEIPCITYVCDLWTKEVTTAPLSCADDGGIATYVDQDGQPFACETVDALRAAVLFARKFSRERQEPIWSEKVLHNMTLAVLEDVFNEGREQ